MFNIFKKRKQYQLPSRDLLTGDMKSLLKTGSNDNIIITLGTDKDGNPQYRDLTDFPNFFAHLLIGGKSRSGKTNFLNSIILSLVYQFTPDDCKLMIIDSNHGDLSIWNGLPHLIQPVIINDLEKSKSALDWVIQEMDNRYQKLKAKRVDNITEYNKSVKRNKMPYLVVVIDEIADLLTKSRRKTERYLKQISSTARSAGIHLIITTQYTDNNTIKPVIRAHFPVSIAFKTKTGKDSTVIIGEKGAEKLNPCGEMLLSDAGLEPVLIKTLYIPTDDIKHVVDTMS